MNKKAKHSILTVIIYAIFTYIILTPLKTWIFNIPISILIGCLFGILNDILSEIRKLNNKIENYSDLDDLYMALKEYHFEKD